MLVKRTTKATHRIGVNSMLIMGMSLSSPKSGTQHASQTLLQERMPSRAIPHQTSQSHSDRCSQSLRVPPSRSPGGPLWAPNPMLWVPHKFENLPKFNILAFLGSKIGLKKVVMQALGPPQRDPGRNSASDPGLHVPNGGIATHLVAKRCDLGSLGVLGPASTPESLHFEPPIYPA